MATFQQAIRQVTADYLADDACLTKTPEEIEGELLELTNAAIARHNRLTDDKGDTWPRKLNLEYAQIADIMMRLYDIRRINCAGNATNEDYDLLGIYQTDGDDKGIYVTGEPVFRRVARSYCYGLDNRSINEILVILKDSVPRVVRSQNRNLVAVNNGIFNYKTKELEPFSPDHVFLTKSRVDYVENPKNVVIHNDTDGTDWDVESWMQSLSDDPEIVNILWELLSAIIRPNVRWNKSAWLYSNKGNNGKGTLCELMRSLCGEGSYASISIADFGKDFLLEPLITASAIIVDENDVGSWIDRAANLKAVITNDVIQINRKHKQPIPYQFHGFMVQCLNDLPRIKDKSDSFYRRQLFIPMQKCFTGRERKYIKDDYLHRKEVLEYVLHKVLNTNFYQLSEPEACKVSLEEYKMHNDPIRQFWGDFHDRFVWDAIPYTFLYSLYKSWYRRTAPEGKIYGKNQFIENLANVIYKDPDWAPVEKQFRLHGEMRLPEPLIAEYELEDWYNPIAKSSKDINVKCTTTQVTKIRGIRRLAASPIVGGDDNA